MDKHNIELMRISGRILGEILDIILARAVVGVTPRELDALAKKETQARGAEPAFLGFQGYPASLCVSRNEEVVHGIPGTQPLEEGDIVSFDFGVTYQGWCTDAARTMIIGKRKDPEKKRIMEVCKESFFMGVKEVRDGAMTGDIGHAIQTFVESHGFSVIRALVGHGVGRSIHEDPRVPNFGSPKTGATLHAGMTIAIEPMIAAGSFEVYTKPDRWTVAMRDGSISAHYEETVLVTKKGYEILTR